MTQTSSSGAGGGFTRCPHCGSAWAGTDASAVAKLTAHLPVCPSRIRPLTDREARDQGQALSRRFGYAR